MDGDGPPVFQKHHLTLAPPFFHIISNHISPTHKHLHATDQEIIPSIYFLMSGGILANTTPIHQTPTPKKPSSNNVPALQTKHFLCILRGLNSRPRNDKRDPSKPIKNPPSDPNLTYPFYPPMSATNTCVMGTSPFPLRGCMRDARDWGRSWPTPRIWMTSCLNGLLHCFLSKAVDLPWSVAGMLPNMYPCQIRPHPVVAQKSEKTLPSQGFPSMSKKNEIVAFPQNNTSFSTDSSRRQRSCIIHTGILHPVEWPLYFQREIKSTPFSFPFENI
ncbi:uncharacterized protein BDR25DRAFT_362587 [Lindgomyces ingoldianus]|uniref:Uncharacterized protein n=1 Tax=Lindgomyces ingoldianus TaxID=673940 RepID=A0ACB6QB29_9PLEO|nr:uncharacterized protein BDR25DRAFT_362587 [Lindgomyces ingoldianus]KAF2463587.1 hypothetical protein BDR25DRAFT_362587 [Lindgomyces ingoldianus]